MRPRRPRSPDRIAAIALAAVLLVVFGIWLGGHASWLPSWLRGSGAGDSNAQLTDQVLNMLAQDYYRPIDRSRLLNTGLAQMVASLNDPYSHYYDPVAYRGFLDNTNPHLSGIGIDVEVERQGLRVVDVFAGSPAARAGLQRGDVIVKVGGTSLANRSAEFGSRLIRGRAGTRVTLTAVRGRRQIVISIVRADIVVPVAASRLLTYHGVKIGQVQLTSFVEGAGQEVRTQVEKMLHSGARALILDLRENGGGLLDEAVNVASIFIPDGEVVKTAGRNQPTQIYDARGGAISRSLPMVVLVDRGTASASEIVTGALRDRGRAKVVGTRTYGKGVFQEIEPLSNGGALDITVGEYFTPNGTNLGGGGVKEGRGIKPDVYAADPAATGPDTQLQTAERTVAAEVR